ncbi:histone PARylation factor 1 [Ceratina calcarata]|uniref:Histone PARylation factor 1 n=1 Tax=Ceratina calcarata TaxID=156304 RepID=A0AAJ7NCR4_9HYME|nr:histone PARylation factor 1 [Ceratina calcarata]
MSDDEKPEVSTKDTRIPCRYGAKCYQKNPVHHQKYKHLPATNAKIGRGAKRTVLNKKRKKTSKDRTENESPQKKVQKTENGTDDEAESVPVVNNIDENNDVEESKSSESEEHEIKDSSELVTVSSLLGDVAIESDKISLAEAQPVISHLFLVQMPDDFFQFYEFCQSISEKNPLNVLNDFHLQLVGPFDVFRETFLEAKVEDKQALLRHWRYYYDPPEFQTIIRDNGKDGLHYGYWRDDSSEKPVFVAKNKAAINCTIESVAENIFGTLNEHIGDKLKLASPFEKPRISKFLQRLKNFAKEKNISLEKKTAGMQAREKKVVARTFHKGGIVVPYDKKTQLGYRDLTVTDNELQKLLKQIEHPPTPEARKTPISKLEEVIRLATIAADECDFGTVLELGHDLFSSGVSHVQTRALNLLSLAYGLLQRPEFQEIARAHLKNRRKSLEPSVLQFEQ